MKRDMDLVRLILLEIEHCNDGAPLQMNFEIPNYTPEQVSYHLMILNDSGLIEASDLSTMGRGIFWRPKRLTWFGHEFLDAARNDSNWEKAKKKAKDINMGFDFLKELLLSLAKQQLEL